MNIKINKIEIAEPKIKRCRCGKCNNKMVIVEFEKTNISFNDKLEWIPTLKEAKAIKEIIEAIYGANVSGDNYCYKAAEKSNKN